MFKQYVLPELPVNALSPFFNVGFGRPTKDLYTVVGVLILQQTHDLTDLEAVDQLAFNIQWHYALNIFEESDSAKYMCPKTLWNMRTIVAENGLEETLFNAGTQKLAEVFSVDTEKQRIDSVHIRSNMRRLGRINIFYKVDSPVFKEPETATSIVEVERAHESDAHALIPAIESAKKRELAPKELLADSLYGSDENIETAKGKGVDVISPPMGSEKEDTLGFSDFHIEKSGKVVKCPQGHAPISNTRNKTRHCAAFDLAHCNDCPNQSICPVKPGKKAFYLRFTDKQLRIALRRSAVDTDEFKDRYRWRAGVEATMSEFDRRTGVKRLRVRGFKAVRFSATLKALGLNILRAAVVMAAMLAGIPEKTGLKGGNDAGVNVFKERFWAAFCFFARLLGCRLNYKSICL